MRNFFHKGVAMYISEKAMAPHSSTLAWKIPWMEESGGLQMVTAAMKLKDAYSLEGKL